MHSREITRKSSGNRQEINAYSGLRHMRGGGRHSAAPLACMGDAAARASHLAESLAAALLADSTHAVEQHLWEEERKSVCVCVGGGGGVRGRGGGPTWLCLEVPPAPSTTHLHRLVSGVGEQLRARPGGAVDPAVLARQQALAEGRVGHQSDPVFTARGGGGGGRCRRGVGRAQAGESRP